MLLGLLLAPRAAHAAPQPVDGELEGEGALGHQDVGDLGDGQVGAELFAEFLELLPGVLPLGRGLPNFFWLWQGLVTRRPRGAHATRVETTL